MEAVIRTSILPELGGIALDRLTTKRIRAWHEALAARPRRFRGGHQRQGDLNDEDRRRREATANRTLTILGVGCGFLLFEWLSIFFAKIIKNVEKTKIPVIPCVITERVFICVGDHEASLCQFTHLRETVLSVITWKVLTTWPSRKAVA
jgi:hypothetical protein